MPVELARGVNEVKSKIITFSEKFIPQIKLEIIEGATLVQAKEMDSKGGNFGLSANLYHSVLETSGNTEERLVALVGLSQQLINLGNLEQAKKVIHENSLDIVRLGSPGKELYYRAYLIEKLGRIADSEGNYKTALSYFSRARNTIGAISEEYRTKGEKEVYSTAVHFLGRANFGMGRYEEAVGHFSEHLGLHGLADDELAYGHAWLVRCYVKKQNFDKASEELDKTKQYFEKYMDTHPERGVMAKYKLVEGEFYFAQGRLDNAAVSFNNSLDISFASEDGTNKSKAEAMFGLAGVAWAQKEWGKAFFWAKKGVSTYPLILIKPSL